MSIEQEKAGLAKVIDHLKAKGWFPTRIWDGECTIKVTGWETDGIVGECAQTDEAALHFSRIHPCSAPEHNHIFLVWGNSPEELIADHSLVGTFEQDIDEVLAIVFPGEV